jgi:hypothetical protein
VLRKLRRLSWFFAAVSRCTPLLCICGLAVSHHTKSINSKATYTAAPPCNRHLPAASGTGTEAMRLRCWHKPMLLQASHASQATLRSPLRCSFLTASAAPPAVRMAGGGGRSAFLLFAAFVPHLLRSSRLPCQWLQCTSQL